MTKIRHALESNRQLGMSLVELMVALTIGMIVSLALFSTLISSQQQNKKTTSTNNRNQAGAFASHLLDLLLRNAGNGLIDYTNKVAGVSVSSYGCLLHAAKNGQTLLPSGAFAAPFNTVSGQVRLAPFLIKNGNSGDSDVLLVMQSAGNLSSIPSQLLTAPGTASVSVNNALAYQGQDRVLLVGQGSQPCLVSQVQTGFVPTEGDTNLPLDGDYYQSSISGVALSDAGEYVVNIGQLPKFFLLGVSNQDGHLYQYDLLAPANNSITNTNPNLFIENAVSLQAIYGVDNNGDGDLSDLTWVQPTGTYDYTALTANPDRINRIKAVKVALVLRADARDAQSVADADVTVFSDTAIPITIPLDDAHYRYKAFEVTVPIRNSLL